MFTDNQFARSLDLNETLYTPHFVLLLVMMTVIVMTLLHPVVTLTFSIIFQQCNDVMLMCYLSTITKGANSLNEVCCLLFAVLLRSDEATVYCTFQ